MLIFGGRRSLNYGKLFWGTVLPFSVILLIISILAMTDMFGEDSGLSLAGAVFSLFGGLAGGLSAFFIAREQIKKQESMKIVDLKLQKFQEIISCTTEIRQGLYDYQRLVKQYFEKNPSHESINFYSHHKDDICGIYNENKKQEKEIYKNMVYMKTLGFDEYEVHHCLRYVDDIYVFEKHFKSLERENLLKHVNHKMYLTNGYIEDFQEKFEKEIEYILLKP